MLNVRVLVVVFMPENGQISSVRPTALVTIPINLRFSSHAAACVTPGYESEDAAL